MPTTKHTLVIAFKMSTLSSTVGNPIHKTLSNRPGRKIAGSIMSVITLKENVC